MQVPHPGQLRSRAEALEQVGEHALAAAHAHTGVSAVAPTRAERDEQRRIVSSGAYDQRYHLRCDTVANINYTALDQMSDAAATPL